MTWPTAEERARSPSPNRFISRQLSRVDYEEEDPEAEEMVGDVPLIRVPLQRADSPVVVQAPADQGEQPPEVPKKHEEEENPLELEEIVGKQIELTHIEGKGEPIVEDSTLEKEPFAPKEARPTKGGVSFILGGSVCPKKGSGQKMTRESLLVDEALMYDVDDALERC